MNTATVIGYVAGIDSSTSDAGVVTIAFTIAPEADRESPDLSWGPALPIPVRARLSGNLETPANGDLVLACGKIEAVLEKDEARGRHYATALLRIDGFKGDLRVLKPRNTSAE